MQYGPIVMCPVYGPSSAPFLFTNKGCIFEYLKLLQHQVSSFTSDDREISILFVDKLCDAFGQVVTRKICGPLKDILIHMGKKTLLNLSLCDRRIISFEPIAIPKNELIYWAR